MDMQVCTEPSESQEKKHLFSGYAIGRNIHQPPNIIALHLKRSANFSLMKENVNEYHDEADACRRIDVGTVFLYSSLHLGPDYAATLAKWLDVGQANNP
jgi:hypothetical protein